MDQLKITTMMINGISNVSHGIVPGGAALAAIRLAEWLSVTVRPAQTRPDVDAQSELRVERPIRCPDS